MIKALDTETTGVDHFHGAQPFMVSVCYEDYTLALWEWEVDPLTRKVTIPPLDIEEILHEVETCDRLVMQNGVFDVHMLTPYLPEGYAWPWKKLEDTLMQGHLVASNHEHNLTSMAIEHLGVNIQPLEDAVEEAVKACRSLVDKKDSPIGDWLIAKKDLEGMPSAKEKTWKYDMWLPRAVVEWGAEGGINLNDQRTEDWLSVTANYCNGDTATALRLHQVLIKTIEERDLLPIYRERMRLLPIKYAMEQRGITYSGKRLQELKTKFTAESEAANRKCVNIAATYEDVDGPYQLTLPKAGNNKSLSKLLLEVMKLPVLDWTDKGNPCLDKKVMESYLNQLPAKSKPLVFIQSLIGKRKCDTSLGYMESYERFGIEVKLGDNWYVLHPSLNPTGTATLRWSSNNPNEQNISKQEDYNLRYCFGPLPGREWWSLDAKNIELRIPAYESGEQDLIGLFEKPDDPPYYGSTHLLNFHTVYPDIWGMEFKTYGEGKVGPHCKKKYAASWYQWCKNGGFAIQYGAGEQTADSAFHKAGAHRLLKARFSKLEAHNQRCISQAENTGYVETIPDPSIGAVRGYPILCTRTERGGILPTVPLNYRTQSTAMWWMARAMVRTNERLAYWRSQRFDAHIALQVHDELVFDLPKGRGSRPWLTNLAKIKVLAGLMAQGGEDINIPTPVGIEYHAENWAEGVTL